MLELQTILNEMTNILSQLTDILETEQRILLENRLIHSLGNVIDEKNQLLIKLKLLDEKRILCGQQHLIAMPYNAIPTLAKQWDEINKTTTLLAKQNRQNGVILQSRMDHTLQAINFFKKLNQQDLYTHGGYQQIEPLSTKRAEA